MIELKEQENYLIEILKSIHNDYLLSKKDYSTLELSKKLHTLRPKGTISGFIHDTGDEIEHEWLLDFYWYTPAAPVNTPINELWHYFNGLDLACEIEWSYPAEGNYVNILSDLQKLMAVKAQTHLFITQLKKEANINTMISWLEQRMRMSEFRCLFIVLPVHNRLDNELIAFRIEGNKLNIVK